MKKKLLKVGVIVLIVIVLVFIGIKVFTTGRISITLPNATENSTYEVRRLNDNAVVKSGDLDSETSLIVTSGEYEILVKSGFSNYFASVKVPRFLGSAKVEASLADELNREFIAETPGLCSDLIGESLISSNCSGPATSIRLHTPATNTTPSRGANDSTLTGHDIENTFMIDGVLYALIQKAGSNTSYRAHEIYRIDIGQGSNSLNLVKIKELKWVDSKLSYKMTNYDNGLLLYSLTGNKAYFYKSLQDLDSPTDFTLPKAENSKLEPTALVSNNDSLAMLFSRPISEDSKTKTTRSEVVVLTKSDQKSLKPKNTVSKISFCGNLLCVIDENTKLTAYNTDNWATEYQVAGVMKVLQKSDSEIFIAKSDGLLRYNPSQRSGSFDYYNNNYKITDFNLNSGGLAAVNLSGGGSASTVLLTSSAPNKTIDQKVLKLEQSGLVSAVSAYKNFIYISPDLGDMKYDPVSGEFGYSTTVKNAAKNQIDAKIKELDFSGYSVKTPLLD